MWLAFPVIFCRSVGFLLCADAVDDDIDAGSVFAGHFFNLLGNALLDLARNGCKLDSEAKDDANLDVVVADFVFGDADAAFVAFFGEDFSDTVDKAAANGNDAGDFEGC